MDKSSPVIDFDCYRLGRDRPADEVKFEHLVDKVHSALTTQGFMILVNHGIDVDKIDDTFSASKRFFTQSESTKEKYLESGTDAPSMRGFMNKERDNSSQPWDMKECYNYTVMFETEDMWPEEVPEFKPTMKTLFASCGVLHNRILEVMGYALKLQEPCFFRNSHEGLGTKTNRSHLRSIYYPATPLEKRAKHQIGCGDHTDSGGITIIFQRAQEPGLQAMNLNGDWLPVIPMEGAAIVIIGDVMQRWTGDAFKATLHRVALPSESSTRQSLVFFGKPDDDQLIVCIDNNEKYPALTSEQFYKESAKRTV